MTQLRARPYMQWIAGWWRSNDDYHCLDEQCGDSTIQPGDPYYCNGQLGELYCKKHAAEHSAPPLQEDTPS